MGSKISRWGTNIGKRRLRPHLIEEREKSRILLEYLSGGDRLRWLLKNGVSEQDHGFRFDR